MRAHNTADLPQYNARTVALIWTAAALPMAILGWVVAPALAADPSRPGIERLAVLTAGLIWQFALVVALLRRETGVLDGSVLKRLWLTAPRQPGATVPRRALWWWIVPVSLVTAAFELAVRSSVNQFWTEVLPFMAEPASSSFGAMLDSPEARAQLVGAWSVWGLFLVSALFNTVLGEELLFRGLLLPRMAGVCGRWDWVVNGLLFAAYHLHQPWGMLGSAITGTFCFAAPTRYFRCAWFGVIAHSGQSVFLAIVILGLVLGFG